MAIKITEQDLQGIKIIEPVIYSDNRGCSGETFSIKELEAAGITNKFVLEYEAFNLKKHTLRGIHFQIAPFEQTKLVRVVHGSTLDVVVDLRKDSPNYKKWMSVVLSASNHKQILIPVGFGHAFLTLEDDTSVLYKYDAYYGGACAKTVRWNDPEIGIEWGTDDIVISAADAAAPLIAEMDIQFTSNSN